MNYEKKKRIFKSSKPMNALFIVVLFICFNGCDMFSDKKENSNSLQNEIKESKPVKLTDTRDEFKDKFNTFEKRLNDLQEKLFEGKESFKEFQGSMATADDKNDEFKKIHKVWSNVESETKEIQKNFEILVKAVDALFADLDYKANSISNSELKQSTLSSLSEDKDSFILKLKSIHESLADLNRLNTQVNDNLSALEISYSEEKLKTLTKNTCNEIDLILKKIKNGFNDFNTASKTVLLSGGN